MTGGGDEGPPTLGHQAQNALARAVCLLEEAQDRGAGHPPLLDALDKALDEIVEAGRLISRLR